MWQVVFIASSEEEADSILNIMDKEGFITQISASSSNNYQIKVPAAEAEEAYSCLHKNFLNGGI